MRKTPHSYPILLSCIFVVAFSAMEPTQGACTVVAAFLCNGTDTRSWSSYPSSNGALIPLLGQWWESGPTTRLEQTLKWERRHTLTQNLKAIGLWVLSLIKCLTSTCLSDVGHSYSHLHTTKIRLKTYTKH